LSDKTPNITPTAAAAMIDALNAYESIKVERCSSRPIGMIRKVNNIRS
jgi:hypothetical protein